MRSSYILYFLRADFYFMKNNTSCCQHTSAGVHSGDATLVLPAQRLYVQTVRAVKHAASLIAKALRISGPFNIQFLAKDNMVKVIECNLRASRTFPFVSKTLDCNFISLATTVMMGVPCKAYNISLLGLFLLCVYYIWLLTDPRISDYDYVVVKAPMFSFNRLRGADPTLGVEMASTGEVACFGRDVQEAYLQVGIGVHAYDAIFIVLLLQALLAANFKLPVVGKGTFILISIAEEKLRMEFLESATNLSRLGFKLAGNMQVSWYVMVLISFWCGQGLRGRQSSISITAWKFWRCLNRRRWTPKMTQLIPPLCRFFLKSAE